MTSTTAKADWIAEILNRYFPDPAIPLTHSSPFTLLIAVLLSARCTDKKVNEITPLLFEYGTTPAELMQVPVDAIREIIKPCGLSPRKSQAIHDLCVRLEEDFGGAVPPDFEALESLPGIGHKSASVIMTQAFNVPAFPVDTHIHRLAKRWGLSEARNVIQTENDLKRCFPRDRWNKVHLQMIYFGRAYCPARGHVADGCPICSGLNGASEVVHGLSTLIGSAETPHAQ